MKKLSILSRVRVACRVLTGKPIVVTREGTREWTAHLAGTGEEKTRRDKARAVSAVLTQCGLSGRAVESSYSVPKHGGEV